MARRKRSSKSGLSPGTLMHIGAPALGPTRLSLYLYGAGDSPSASQPVTPEEAFASIRSDRHAWLDIEGVHDVELIRKIGEHFSLHSLTLEDIVATDQRPKREDLDGYIYLVAKMISLNPEKEIVAEQLSIVFGTHYLLSFQEQHRKGDVFDPVRQRLLGNKGRLARAGSDYLAYALLDTVVDSYFTVLEQVGERVESLEKLLIENPAPPCLHELYELKRQTLFLRKNIWPLREVISGLTRDGSSLIAHETAIYLKDLYDHTVHVMETIEGHREVLASLLDIYLSSTSNRLNTVMKFLTILSTIFMPLTFISSIYGMNFKHMPELEWEYGYPFAIFIMTAITVAMVAYFRRKGWL